MWDFHMPLSELGKCGKWKINKDLGELINTVRKLD